MVGRPRKPAGVKKVPLGACVPEALKARAERLAEQLRITPSELTAAALRLLLDDCTLAEAAELLDKHIVSRTVILRR